MTADISLRLYNLTFEFIKDKAKAQEFVSKIESTIENKFQNKKDTIASKEDIRTLENKLNDQFKWLVGIIISMFGLTITIMFFLFRH